MANVTAQHDAIANRTAIAMKTGHEQYQPLAPMIFNQVEPTRVDEVFRVLGGDGAMEEVAEDAAYPGADILEAGRKTISQVTYKKKWSISKLLNRFDSEGELMRFSMGQGRRAAIKRDRVAATVLNNGFTTETVWDGNSLFNNSHTIGVSGATNDNLVTGALTDSTLNDAIVALRDLKAHDTLEDPLAPRYLVVPTALEKKARELVDSGLDPESANNTVNTHRSRGIQVVVWELLTSSTAWFLLSDKMFHSLMQLDAIPYQVEKRDPIYTENGVHEVRCDMSCAAGASDYLGAVGSLGT